MDATAEIQVVPIGAGVSVRTEIKRVVEILRGFDLTLGRVSGIGERQLYTANVQVHHRAACARVKYTEIYSGDHL